MCVAVFFFFIVYLKFCFVLFLTFGQELSELEKLQVIPSLKVLSLRGNPVSMLVCIVT